MTTKKGRRLPPLTRPAPGTTTITLPQGRDRRGRFTPRRTVVLSDWIDDKQWPETKLDG
jgi:hypothetical protein